MLRGLGPDMVRQVLADLHLHFLFPEQNWPQVVFDIRSGIRLPEHRAELPDLAGEALGLMTPAAVFLAPASAGIVEPDVHGVGLAKPVHLRLPDRFNLPASRCIRACARESVSPHSRCLPSIPDASFRCRGAASSA